MKNEKSYDSTNIHKVYDFSRDLPSETMSLWLDTIKKYVDTPIDLITDLGCGAGRFTDPLSKHFNTKVIGIEPSFKMLSIAIQKDKDNNMVSYREGNAENIPLENDSVSMVFMSMVYHHLKSVDKALNEIGRVLKANGYLVIRNATKENIFQNELDNIYSEIKKQNKTGFNFFRIN